MIREVQSNYRLIGFCIFAVLAAGLFGGGYWVGHRGMDEMHMKYEYYTERNSYLTQLANEEGWWGNPENPIRINAECHSDASDWAMIRMANQIGYERDIPVFVHGNCQTHQVVDLRTKSDIFGL